MEYAVRCQFLVPCYNHAMKEKERSFWSQINPFRELPEDLVRNVEVSIARKIFFLVFLIGIFIFALQVIKLSVSENTGTILETYARTFTSTPLKAFFFGWIGTVVSLSGSPIAATAVSLFSIGFVDTITLMYLIIGSRGGPDLVLFLVGLITLIRKRNVSRTLGLGLLEFFTTASVILAMAFFSPFIFESRINQIIAHWFQGATMYASFIQQYFEPLGEKFVSLFPDSLSFLVGFLLLIFAIFLFDRFFTLFNLRSEKMKSWFQTALRNPFFAFLLGALITSLTLSTAVSVGVLVPFYAYGIIGTSSVLAYVLAANITTLIDTLFIAILTGDIVPVQVVTSLMLTGTIFVIFVGLFYRRYVAFVESVSRFLLKNPWRLLLTIVLSIAVPLLVILT